MTPADDRSRQQAPAEPSGAPSPTPAGDSGRISEQMQAEMSARMESQGFERPWNQGWESDVRVLEDDQSYWLLTMVDLMTLLLTLFVLLAAYAYHQKNNVTAQPASGQQKQMGAAQPIAKKPGRNLPTAGLPPTTDKSGLITTQPGSLISTNPNESDKTQKTPAKPAKANKPSKEDLAEQQKNAEKMFSGLGKDVDISVIKGRINLRVRDNILFSTGNADMSGKGKQLIDRLAQRLKQGNYAISVEGHTDNRPIHTSRYPSNWELSAARAAAVLRELVSQGVTPDRLSAVGYADTRPVASNDTPAGQAANRRVDLVLHLPGKKGAQNQSDAPSQP